MTDRLSAGQLRDIADAAERGFNAHGSSQLAVLADELRKEAADREREEKPAPSPCKCGHAASAHIYDTGKCRPGFLCPDDCAEYTPKPKPEPTPSPATREDWGELAKRLRKTDPISGVALALACGRLADGRDVIRPAEYAIDLAREWGAAATRAESAESRLAEVEKELAEFWREVHEALSDGCVQYRENPNCPPAKSAHGDDKHGQPYLHDRLWRILARTAPGSAS